MVADAQAGDADLVGGRYRLQKLLGRGGMGAVHLALDETSGELVALKRLRSDAASDTLVTLFEREYRALASLRHPRIVRVFEYGLDRHGAYYTMELLEGSDLSDTAPMPWREVCSCLRDAASILGVLHVRRLVHRDLSPRNLWRTPDGRLKLLDFGALAPFGNTTEIVGTPPLTAPETLQGGPLDGRTDLYSLGALGYWLLTSTHAYPARTMASLQEHWKHEPAPPSSLVRLIKSVDHDVPAALDDLLLSLLRLDPAERPRHVADIVDALNDAAALPPESQEVVVQGYLENGAFVGRRKERARFERSLRRAHEGTPGSLLIAAPDGCGRTRLVQELALTARLSGASVVELHASGSGKPYEIAVALCRSLLGILPQAARAAAAPHMKPLSALSSEVAELLRASRGPNAPVLDRNQERLERQTALVSFIRTLSREHTLVLALDDIHTADEESQALLAELAHSDAEHRLLLVTSIVADQMEDGLSVLGNLARASQRLDLLPLSEQETRELLGSLFGEVPYLDRVSARLHVLSKGRPDHTLMLARHLVRCDAVRYAEGSWSLPLDLPDDLPASVDAGALAQLESASPDARSLARKLSLPDHGPMTRAMVRALCQRDERSTEARLTELSDIGVLRLTEDSVQIAHPQVRETLWNELSASEQAAAHLTLARHLERHADGDGALQLRAALHFLRGGDAVRANRSSTSSVRTLMEQGDAGALRMAAPMLVEAYTMMRAPRLPVDQQIPPLVGLGLAGYLVDGAFAVTYGDEARRLLGRVLHLDLARTLRRVVGAKLALVCALLVAAVMLRIRRSCFRLDELVRWFVFLMSSVTGTMASYVDNAAVRRYAGALEPFTSLGSNHAATFAYQYGLALAYGGEEAPSASMDAMQAMKNRLEAPEPIVGLEDTLRSFMVGGCLLSNGIRMNLAARRDALSLADELEPIGPLQSMQADYVRAQFHATQGALEQSQLYRKRLEMQAVRLGNCWQAEVTGPSSDMMLALYTHDAVRLKRAVREIDTLSLRIPSLKSFADYGRASYALLRGRYEQVIQLAEADPVPPLALVGWAQHQGVLAAAYNALGEHERALEVCRGALGRLKPEDLDFVILNLNLRVELAVAEAALGDGRSPRDRLKQMLSTFEERGPLIAGYLHRGLACVAMLQGDRDACEQHLSSMETHYRPLQMPSLRSLTARLKSEVRRRLHPDHEGYDSELLSEDAHLMTRVRLLLSQAGHLSTQRAATGLQLAIDLTGAEGGFVVQHGTAEPVTTEGEEIQSDVLHWAMEQLASTDEDDITLAETVEGGNETAVDEHALELDGMQHGLTMLWHPGQPSPVAALVLRFEKGQLKLPPDGLRQALAQQLWEAQTASPTEGAGPDSDEGEGVDSQEAVTCGRRG